MNISISDVTLEDLTIICSRIGEISFQEALQEQREPEITSYTEAKTTPVEAEEKQEEMKKDKVQQVLNIDNYPANLESKLVQIATEEFVNKGKSGDLIRILDEFGVSSIPELKKTDYKKVYDKLTNA